MPVKINLNSGNSLGLTESCADIRGFMKAVSSRRREDLVDHLAACPACRKVACDTILALFSDGDPRENPAVIEKIETAASSGGADEELFIAVRAAPGRILETTGPPSELSAKSDRARFRMSLGAEAIVVEVEAGPAAFQIRLSSQTKSDAVAIMKLAGAPILPPRRLVGSISWPGLAAGEYQLGVAGREGRRDIFIKLALKQTEIR